MNIRFKSLKPAKNLVVFFDAKKRLLTPKNWPAEQTARLQRYLKLPEVKAEGSSVERLFDETSERIFLVGLGKKLEPRDLGAQLGKKTFPAEFSELAFCLPEDAQHPIHNDFEAFLEGFFLARYRFEQLKKPDPKKKGDQLTQVALLAKKTKALQDACENAWIQAEATYHARDLCNLPGNLMTPTDLMQACKRLSKETGLKFSALSEAQMEQEGMGCLLGVSKGSDQPAWLNIMEYQGGGKGAPTLMLVGKGLTFDAGGISLKPAGNMHEMKFDMCGGAAVYGAMEIIAKTQPKVNVVALIPTSENLPNGSANKPGDVLTACDGTTVEVLNTDAEGRLILCDAIAYGLKRFKPDAVVDIATLTGACVVALGHYHSGLQASSEKLAKQIENAAERTGDPVWRMPHAEIYDKDLEGTVSDLKNIGGRNAGMITAGLFLKRFVGKTPWAHIDIAGTAWGGDRIPYYPSQGASGTAVRLLADLAANFKK